MKALDVHYAPLMMSQKVAPRKHTCVLPGLKDDVLPETLSSLKIVLPGQKSSLTLDPLKQMVIITP